MRAGHMGTLRLSTCEGTWWDCPRSARAAIMAHSCGKFRSLDAEPFRGTATE